MGLDVLGELLGPAGGEIARLAELHLVTVRVYQFAGHVLLTEVAREGQRLDLALADFLHGSEAGIVGVSFAGNVDQPLDFPVQCPACPLERVGQLLRTDELEDYIQRFQTVLARILGFSLPPAWHLAVS